MARTDESTPLLNNVDDNAASYTDDAMSVTSAAPTPKQQPDLVAQRLNGSPLFVILVGLWVGVFLSSLDSSIVATIYPEIGTEFKRSNDIIWIATSYMLSYTALQPLYGRISDAFGRQSALLFAAAFFFVGSFLCGAADGLWSLVAARIVAGIGGGGLNTMSSVITSDLVSLRERGKYQGYANIAYGLGSVVGAPIGGIITDTVGWRYCFYINLPLLIVTLYTATRLLTNYNLKEHEGESTLWERFKRIDYAGAFTIVLAVVAFMLATSWGGNTRAWSDPVVYGCLIASVILTVIFFIVEANFATHPLMPWHIISSQTPLACSFSNMLSIMCGYGVTYTTPLFFQGLLGYSPSQAGLFFLPKIISMSVGSLAAGFYMSHTGEYRKYLIGVVIACAVSMFSYTQWTPTTSYFIIIPTLMVDGFCSGSTLTAALVAMLSCVEQHEMATITSMSYLFRSVGGVIGIAGTSAIFQGLVKSILAKNITGPDAQEIIDIARKSMNQVRDRLPADALAIVLDTYQVAIYYAFLFCFVIALFGVLSSLFIRQNTLDNKVRK